LCRNWETKKDGKTWTREAQEVRTRIKSTKEDKECNGRVYLRPMQNSKMHKEKLQREKGRAILRIIGGAPKLLREALVARETRQTKKTENEHYIMNLVICSHGWYKSSLMREARTNVLYLWHRYLHGWEASSWTKQLFFPPIFGVILKRFFF
jgi:hypothetical protein